MTTLTSTTSAVQSPFADAAFRRGPARCGVVPGALPRPHARGVPARPAWLLSVGGRPRRLGARRDPAVFGDVPGLNLHR
jgi:hypothetical protein